MLCVSFHGEVVIKSRRNSEFCSKLSYFRKMEGIFWIGTRSQAQNLSRKRDFGKCENVSNLENSGDKKWYFWQAELYGTRYFFHFISFKKKRDLKNGADKQNFEKRNGTRFFFVLVEKNGIEVQKTRSRFRKFFFLKAKRRNWKKTELRKMGSLGKPYFLKWGFWEMKKEHSISLLSGIFPRKNRKS